MKLELSEKEKKEYERNVRHINLNLQFVLEGHNPECSFAIIRELVNGCEKIALGIEDR